MRNFYWYKKWAFYFGFGLSIIMTEAKHPLKWKWSNPTTILRIVESVTYTHAPTTVISGSKSSTLFKELVEHSWDIELKRESAALF